jgi:hypothetical protein
MRVKAPIRIDPVELIEESSKEDSSKSKKESSKSKEDTTKEDTTKEDSSKSKKESSKSKEDTTKDKPNSRNSRNSRKTSRNSRKTSRKESRNSRKSRKESRKTEELPNQNQQSHSDTDPEFKKLKMKGTNFVSRIDQNRMLSQRLSPYFGHHNDHSETMMKNPKFNLQRFRKAAIKSQKDSKKPGELVNQIIQEHLQIISPCNF